MIGALGASPISSVTSAGLNSFVSLLSAKPSKAFGAERWARAYTKTRGIIINKELLKDKPIDLNKGYQFQFNPQTIDDVKTTLYEQRGYAGLPYVDHVWSGGGERLITFELFLDNTPQSHTPGFRPTEYGSSLSDDLSEANKEGYGYDASGRLTTNGKKNYVGQDFVENAVSIGKSIANQVTSIVPSKKPSGFSWVENGAYSHTRINERGVLPEVELLQSFLYPAPLVGESTPKFAEGGVVSNNQFRPPATAVLCIGPIYLEGVLKALPVKYTLFDEDLTPIRATVNVEFSVFEFAEVTRLIEQKK